MGRYIRGNVDEDLGLGTLAAKSLVTGVFDEGVSERTLISSLIATYSIENFTPGAGIGPLLVGIAHSDYSAAEVEAYIETLDSWKEADKIGQEVGKRQIRKIGVFRRQSGAAVDTQALNEGRPIKTKLNWILNKDQTLDLWVYNMGSAAIATTVPVVHCEGHANLWPR